MSREFTMGIRLNYYDNDFTRGIREATKQTNSFRNGLVAAERGASGLTSAIGKVAVALGGMAAVKKGFSWLIGANADMEQYENTLSVVLKSHEKAVETLSWAKEFAAQTPFEIPQVVEATTKLSAYGMEARKVLGITGDMASVMGKSLDQAVEALADAQTGELERLKEFGIRKDMLEAQAKLLGSNPINNQGQITDIKAFNAALFSLMEERFKGGMAKQSESFKGMISNAKDFMGNLGQQLGEPLFERLKMSLKSLLETLNQLQKSGAIDRFVAKAHKGFAAISEGVFKAQRLAVTGFRAIQKASAPVFAFIQKNWANIKPYVQGVAIAIGAVVSIMTAMKSATLVASVALRLLSAAMLTNPIGWIILAIGLLIGWFIKLNGGIDGAKQKLMGWLASAKKFGAAIGAIFKGDGDKGGGMLESLGFNDKQTGALTKGVAVVKQVATQIVTAFQWVQAQAVKYWPVIQATVKQVIAQIVTAFQWLQAQAAKYWPVIQGAVVKAWNYIQANVIPVVKGIAKDVIGMWVKIYNIVVPFVKALVPVLVNAWQTIWKVLQPLAAALGRLFMTLAPIVLKLVAGIYKFVTTYLPPVLAVVMSIFQTILTTAIPIVASIVAGIIQGFTAVVNWFTTIWPMIQKVIEVWWNYIQFVWAAIGPFIMAAIQIIISVIKNGFMFILGIVKFVWNTIKSIIQIAWAIISGIIQTALGILTGDWEKAWEGFKSIFTGVWDGITNFLGGVGTLFYDSGKAIINTLVDGIKSVAMAPVNAVKNIFGKVRDLLPFSDAKKGPLSELTYSGGAIMTTISKGVRTQAGSLTKTVNSAFSNLGLTEQAESMQNFMQKSVSDMGITAALQILENGPVVNIAAPVAPMAAPVVNMAAPVAPMAAPVVNMATPVAPMAAPVAPMAAPVAPMAAPVAPMAAPVVNMAAPVVNMAAPIAPMAAPVVNMAAPIA
ncbi:tape measure protein, partial [Paenibacillus sp. GCM10012307]